LTFFECFQNNLCTTTHGSHIKQSPSPSLDEKEEDDVLLDDRDQVQGDRLLSMEGSNTGRTLSSASALEDELIINWPILLTRIFVIFLIICCIVSLGLGGLDERFFYLASMILGASIIIFISTFFECFQRNLCTTVHAHGKETRTLDIEDLGAKGKNELSIKAGQRVPSIV
jgi:hypothetical protein